MIETPTVGANAHIGPAAKPIPYLFTIHYSLFTTIPTLPYDSIIGAGDSITVNCPLPTTLPYIAKSRTFLSGFLVG